MAALAKARSSWAASAFPGGVSRRGRCPSACSRLEIDRHSSHRQISRRCTGYRVLLGFLFATCTAAALAEEAALDALAVSAAPRLTVESANQFYEHVLPILRSRCFACHGPDSPQGELRLDSRTALLAGGEHGAVVDFNDVANSSLLHAVRYLDPDRQMPPDPSERLTDEQVTVLAEWVGAGAPWPDPVVVLFEDEPAILGLLHEGDGPMEMDPTDRQQGNSALMVGRQRAVATVDGWHFKIAEDPQSGEYRYLRFAWKRRPGQGGVMFELASHGAWRTDTESNLAWSAGINSTGWAATSVSDSAPAEWTVVTRDLWEDRGTWNDPVVTGFCLTAIDGGEVLLDSVLLGPTLASLDAYRHRDRDRAQTTLPQPEQQLGNAWSDADNPVTRTFRGSRLDLWSFQPVRKLEPELPAVLTGSDHPVDGWIESALAAAELQAYPQADKRTLIRRLTYDLTGLPVTADEMEAFLADESASAYEQLVDRLLASPRFGERWARHWLDVVRYADTEGFERDEYRPTMHRFRDYVIRSFNNDKPYDVFVREQLAGDELNVDQPHDAATVDRWIATGFLRLGPRDTTASIFEESEQARDQLLSDLANTTGEAFLGMTISCCQCHDHKYDPLLQVDHFRLRGFFAALSLEDEFPIPTDAERSEIDEWNAQLDEKLRPLQQQLEELLRIGQQRHRTAEQLVADAEVGQDAALGQLTQTERQAWDAATHEREELQRTRKKYPTMWAATDSRDQFRPVRLYFQGDIAQPRDEVPAGVLSILDPNPLEVAPLNDRLTGRRSALAAWVTSPSHPLTARVYVNRVWQQLFGRGIVSTPNDFGYSGSRPTHPQLLDWLAAEFVERGWSTKQLIRLLVTSAAYQRASSVPAAQLTAKSAQQQQAVDMDNRLLWRQSPRRLDAESLRDAMLAVSGALLPMDRGPARWPAIPEFVRASNPATLDDNGRLQGWYTTGPEESNWVRSVFLVQKRTIAIPFLQPFDLPDSTRSCARRDVTIVAPQASTLMNSDFALAISREFAGRVLPSDSRTSSREGLGQTIHEAFRRALSREPEAAEADAAAEFLDQQLQQYQDQQLADPLFEATVDLCRALINSNEFNYVD